MSFARYVPHQAGIPVSSPSELTLAFFSELRHMGLGLARLLLANVQRKEVSRAQASPFCVPALTGSRIPSLDLIVGRSHTWSQK